MNTINQVLVVVLIGLFFFAVIKFIDTSLDKSEVVSCLNFVEQSEKYPQFFITKSQNDMCVRHGIAINAPIK